MHTLLLLPLLVAHRTLACDHTSPSPPIPSAPIAPPTRPLLWGDLNVLHTTDTHGWLLGHRKPSAPEPNYSADFGEFASFVGRMKEIAVEKDADLLLVDSGDLHDGTGLSDGYPPGGIDAHDSNKFFTQLPYDALAIGNHELYIYNNTLDMHTNFAPRFPGRYLTSNANITVNGTSVPVGSRFAKFKTRKGRNVTALGVLFDFKGNAAGTSVQRVEDMVQEPWFTRAIEDAPDVFLLVGHMPVQDDEWPLVFDAIRARHARTPILIFGGHSHVRDCQQYDARSMALQSGRYMETVGWMSVDLDEQNGGKDVGFARRYLDANRVAYEYHTNRSNATFDLPHGRRITAGLEELAREFDLGHLYGYAPRDYTLYRDEYPSNGSLISLFAEQAQPAALAATGGRAGTPAYIIANTGALRFDVFRGPFTKDDQLTAAPFTNGYGFIPNITLGAARAVLRVLNEQGEGVLGRDAWDEAYARGEVEPLFRRWLAEMDAQGGRASNLTPGYVTKDGCPGAGDDTAHAPLPFFAPPDFVASPAPAVPADAPMLDLVFVAFFQDQLLRVLNAVQGRQYGAADVRAYGGLLIRDVLPVYAEEAWCEKQEVSFTVQGRYLRGGGRGRPHDVVARSLGL